MKNTVAVCVLLVAGSVALSAGAVEAQEPSVEAVVATGIVDRMPVGAGTEFPADVGQLYVWTRITGAEGTSIQHVWIHRDVEYPIVLPIRGSPWRTWSSKLIHPDWTGDWRVEIQDQDGAVLETLRFTVG